MTIAASMAFNSGILLFTDAEHAGAGKARHAPGKIFTRHYGVPPGCTCSILVISEPADHAHAAIERCEHAIEALPPVECSIERMKHAVEQSLRAAYRENAVHPEARQLSSFVVLYSPCEQQYGVFRTFDHELHEVSGYDCQGRSSHVGHYLIRDRYTAARSLDGLDLSTVFSIAIEALEGIRACNPKCGPSSEMVVMYADGHVSDIQRIAEDTRKRNRIALAGLART